jgi:hypothetical protein
MEISQVPRIVRSMFVFNRFVKLNTSDVQLVRIETRNESNAATVVKLEKIYYHVRHCHCLEQSSSHSNSDQDEYLPVYSFLNVFLR